MGLWDILDSISEMNRDAVSDAAKLSIQELCYKVNSLNVLMNPLIYSACSDELTKRVQSISSEKVKKYYNEYQTWERTDAKDILEQELNRRGIFISADLIE